MRKSPLIIQNYWSGGLPDMSNCVVKIETPSKQFLVGIFGEKIEHQYIVPLVLNWSVSSQIGHRDTAKIYLSNFRYFPGSHRLSEYLEDCTKILIYATPRPVVHQLSQCIKMFSGQMINIQCSEHIIEIEAQA